MMNEYILPKLHPDLLHCLKDDEIHHPLLEIEVGVYPALYQRINQVYEYKKRTVNLPKLPNEWQSYLPHLSISNRQRQFFTNEYTREDPEYFRMIGQIWTDFETFGQPSSFLEMTLNLSSVPPNKLLSPNVIHLMTIPEQENLDRLPDRFTVYRGHDDRLLHGISWTTDRNIAMQYAIGLNGDRSISTGTVMKKSVIAVIDRWAESEVIVPTNLVCNIDTQSVKKSKIKD
jgi:hypothetical protein